MSVLISLLFVVVVNLMVVMTYAGVGGDSRPGEYGKSDHCKQHVPSDSHNFVAPFSRTGAAFLPCGPVDGCSMP